MRLLLCLLAGFGLSLGCGDDKKVPDADGGTDAAVVDAGTDSAGGGDSSSD